MTSENSPRRFRRNAGIRSVLGNQFDAGFLSQLVKSFFCRHFFKRKTGNFKTRQRVVNAVFLQPESRHVIGQGQYHLLRVPVDAATQGCFQIQLVGAFGRANHIRILRINHIGVQPLVKRRQRLRLFGSAGGQCCKNGQNTEEFEYAVGQKTSHFRLLDLVFCRYGLLCVGADRFFILMIFLTSCGAAA